MSAGRRTDWRMRQTVDAIAALVRRGELDTRGGARAMLEHLVPLHVARRVLGIHPRRTPHFTQGARI